MARSACLGIYQNAKGGLTGRLLHKNYRTLSGATTVLLLELAHSAGRIDNFLLAGIERVTCRTDFHMQFLAESGTGFEGITAGAHNLDGSVLRMNAGFHGESSRKNDPVDWPDIG